MEMATVHDDVDANTNGYDGCPEYTESSFSHAILEMIEFALLLQRCEDISFLINFLLSTVPYLSNVSLRTLSGQIECNKTYETLRIDLNAHLVAESALRSR